MMTSLELKESLTGFYGSQDFHKITLRQQIIVTDGILFLAKNAGCFWLLDVIESYQNKCSKDDMLRDIQFWTLKVKDNEGVVTCERDTDDVAFSQKIQFTDFPLDEIKIIVELGSLDGVNAAMIAMLPSER